MIKNQEYQQYMNEYYALIEAYPNGTPPHISEKASNLVTRAMNAIKGEQHPEPKANARRVEKGDLQKMIKTYK